MKKQNSKEEAMPSRTSLFSALGRVYIEKSLLVAIAQEENGKDEQRSRWVG
jgi:hypothetical protein